MVCGIYRLVFTGYDKYYVGQSINIHRRFMNHMYRLRNNKHNYKVQAAYLKYGDPTLEILQECSTEELNTVEQNWIVIYNSVDGGLNIATEPSIYQEGEANGYSKYSNTQIEQVFSLLLDLSYKYSDIAEITGVPIHNIRHISNGESHLWLERKFPEDYAVLKSFRGLKRQSASNSAKAQGITYPKVVHPLTGEEYEITNATAFAKEYGLDPSYFSKLLRGKALTCKGWKVVKNTQ